MVSSKKVNLKRRKKTTNDMQLLCSLLIYLNRLRMRGLIHDNRKTDKEIRLEGFYYLSIIAGKATL